MFQNIKIKNYVFLTIILSLLIGLLFRESFSGLLLQGVDDNISMRSVIVRSLLSGQGYHFISNYWLGFIFNVPNPDLYNSILALTGSARVVGVYIIALFLSGFVTFKLIKRLDVSYEGAIFGAISYTFLPHVLSLVYSGHALALEAIPMTPAFLLCLSVILDGKTDSRLLKGLASLWGGIFWAWMMIGEPQRGVYGTVLGMAWVLYLMIQTQAVSFKIKNIKDFLPMETLKNKVSYLGVILIVGLSVFLPTLKFWSNSEFLNNQGSWEFATSWSFPPAELINTFAFGYHGLSSSEADFPYYGDKPISGNTDSLGFFLLLFAILAISFAWKSKKKGLRFFAITGLVALLLSFGKYFPGSPLFWLWYQIPGMDAMRVPAKFLSITGLSWAIIAAMGLDTIKEIFESNQEKIKKTILIIMASIAIMSIMWFILLAMTDGGEAVSIRKVLGRANRAMIDAALTGRINSILSMASLFTASFGIFLLCYLKPQFTKFLPLAIILLTMQNLYVSNRFYIERTYVDEKTFYPKTELINFLQNNLGSSYRASGSLFFPNLTGSPSPTGSIIEQPLYPLNNNDLTYAFPYFDINMMGRIPVSRLDEGYLNFFESAYNSVTLYQDYKDIWEMTKRLWFMGNVKYILVGEESEKLFAEQLIQDTTFITNLRGSYNHPVSIYELNNKLPRFAWIQNVKSTNMTDMMSEMENSLQDLSNYALPIEYVGLPLEDKTNPIPPSLVNTVKTAYNAYTIPNPNSSQNHILYFGDLYDKGWKAYTDGSEISIHKANIIQQYIYVPEGTQEIKIEYDRPVRGLLYSRILIIFAIIGALAIFIYQLKNNIRTIKTK